jgi:polysaccharide export outer membrane protein
MERIGLAIALIVSALALHHPQAFAQTPASAAGQAAEDDSFFRDIYREFYDTYRLGPGDEIAIRVTGQPDYTVELAKVSPAGRVYHPLLGDLEVAGMTIPQLIERLTKDMGEYLINPKVSASLLEANSAKIGVLGDVLHPGVLIMNKPMTVLEALTASGGVADTGSKSGVLVLRQTRDGRAQMLKVNVKRILEGKAGVEENISLRAGDTVIVNGNAKKKMSYILSLAGFASFLSFITTGGGR